MGQISFVDIEEPSVRTEVEVIADIVFMDVMSFIATLKGRHYCYPLVQVSKLRSELE